MHVGIKQTVHKFLHKCNNRYFTNVNKRQALPGKSYLKVGILWALPPSLYQITKEKCKLETGPLWLLNALNFKTTLVDIIPMKPNWRVTKGLLRFPFPGKGTARRSAQEIFRGNEWQGIPSVPCERWVWAPALYGRAPVRNTEQKPGKCQRPLTECSAALT